MSGSAPSVVYDDVKAGLDRADALQPGHGWVAADVTATTDVPLTVRAEGGLKLNPTTSLYGDVWTQPTLGRLGADVGARFNSNLDLFAGGWADQDSSEVEAGLRWHF